MFRILSAYTIIFLVSACSKPQQPRTPAIAPAGEEVKICNGKNFCYLKDDVAWGFNAKWRRIPASFSTPERIRIYHEENQGMFQVEIDVYSTTPGFFGVTNDKPASGDATFTYFEGQLRLKAMSGLVEITDINEEDNTLTGSFYATAERNDTLYKFTEGNMVNVTMK